MIENEPCKLNIFAYEGYLGSIEADVEANMLHGKILGINDIITYHGENLAALKSDFQSAVKEYIEHCSVVNKKPEKTCSGKILLRISPELHGKVTLEAKRSSASINSFIASAIEKYLNQPQTKHCG